MTNLLTYWSLNGQTNQEENDHKEADTLMIRCLKLGSDAVHTNVVSVYSADTDVFFCCCLIQISWTVVAFTYDLSKALLTSNFCIQFLAMVPQKHCFPYMHWLVVILQGNLMVNPNNSGLDGFWQLTKMIRNWKKSLSIFRLRRNALKL